MRKIKLMIITLSGLFICMQGNAQGYYQWGDPYPMTDSLSDNTNPVLFTTWEIMSESVFMFWEKSTDTLSTEIWMDNLLDNEPPEVVLSAPGIHFRHPKVMSALYYPVPDSMFYLFYETNQNENIDIYYKVYLEDGSFTDTEPFSNNSGDDIELSVGDEYATWDFNIVNVATWINDGKLYGRFLRFEDNSYYFDDAQLIDSNNCSDPTSSGGQYYGENVSYLRPDSGSKHIYTSSVVIDGSWSIPEVYYDSSNSENLTRSHYNYGLSWSALIDSNWRIILNTYWSGNYIFDISSQTPFDPAVLAIVYGVDDNYVEAWVAVPYEENGVDEIFMYNSWTDNEFTNFSNSGTMNRNSQFFQGENYPDYCFYNYLLWESYRNGHWQIWASKVIQCMGAINEMEIRNNFITSHPNPFTHETNIKFTLDERSNAVLNIFDSRGVRIASLANQVFDQGDHQLRWNADGLPAGIYIIKMTVGGKVYSSKVVKSQ